MLHISEEPGIVKFNPRPSKYTQGPVVLGTDHVLVTDDRVTGVIDFSDVSFGDPDYDFSSLYLDVCEEFTIDVARRYGHPDTERLLEKLRYFEVADQVDTIVDRDGQALPGQREQAWQRLRHRLA